MTKYDHLKEENKEKKIKIKGIELSVEAHTILEKYKGFLKEEGVPLRGVKDGDFISEMMLYAFKKGFEKDIKWKEYLKESFEKDSKSKEDAE
jgi:hypothetical protein